MQGEDHHHAGDVAAEGGAEHGGEAELAKEGGEEDAGEEGKGVGGHGGDSEEEGAGPELVKDDAEDDPAEAVGHTHDTEEETAVGRGEAALHRPVSGEGEAGEDAHVEEEVGDEEDEEGGGEDGRLLWWSCLPFLNAGSPGGLWGDDPVGRALVPGQAVEQAEHGRPGHSGGQAVEGGGQAKGGGGQVQAGGQNYLDRAVQGWPRRMGAVPVRPLSLQLPGRWPARVFWRSSG